MNQYITLDSKSLDTQTFHVRQLELNDFHKGFLRVLGMLTTVGSLTFGQYIGKILYLYFRSLQLFKI